MTTFLKFPEVCERYRVTPMTLRRWVNAGEFPAPVRIRNRSYFDANAIADFETRRKLSG